MIRGYQEGDKVISKGMNRDSPRVLIDHPKDQYNYRDYNPNNDPHGHLENICPNHGADRLIRVGQSDDNQEDQENTD